MPDENGSSLMTTFKQKLGPLPLGAWIGIIAVIGGYMWYRHKQATASTSAAADQSNSNLGTAGSFPLNTAGTMPYSGGDTYINSVGSGTIGGPATAKTVNVGAGTDGETFVNSIRAKINPNFTWADFWALNPGIAASMKLDPKKKTWTFTKPVTVTISSPTTVDLPGGITVPKK